MTKLTVTNPPTSESQASIKLPRTSESDKLKRIRHTTSHVMAMAVQKLFPQAQVTIGPWTETGFYYDFDVPEPFSEGDLKAIKKEMDKIIKRQLPVVREEVSRVEAEQRIKAIKEPYKLEILQSIQEPITLYHLGEEWWDLCAGPHLESTAELNPKAIELETVAGAYWRGDETKAQLQRIYGTAWETAEQLAEYKRRKEEAIKRDHRKLGKELGLFIFTDLVGPGLPLWTPKGTIIRSTLEDFLKHRFTTFERIEYIRITVIKQNGQREAFDRSKLLRGIIRACEKTGLSVERLEGIVDEMESQLQQHPDRMVTSEAIGKLALQYLRQENEVAYIRFASVYGRFQGIAEFVDTLNQLQSSRNR